PETAAPNTAADARVTLLPIQTGGAHPPLFYLHVHWIGGAGYSFTLAHELGADQPLYVIDPYKFEGLAVPPSIETIAARYIQTIRGIQPEGPYFLAGFCAGGLLAYEIARQLRAVGQTIDLLALIDPMAGPIQSIRLCGALIRGMGKLLRLDAAKQLDLFLRTRYLSRILRHAE